MHRKPRGPFNQEFKFSAVQRVLAGENVCALARSLDVSRKDLYVWRDRYRTGGVEALAPQKRGPKPKGSMARMAPPSSAAATPSPQPPTSGRIVSLSDATARIAELEQKVGQQALELDFFQQALRHFEKTRQPDDGLGVTASTRPSKP